MKSVAVCVKGESPAVATSHWRDAILCVRWRHEIAALQCPEFCADGTAPVPPVLRILRVSAMEKLNPL